MNVRAVASVARSSGRRHIGSLVVLVLLVAMVGAVVLSAVAGAHRTATALDRYKKTTDQPDMGVYALGLDAADAGAVLGAVPEVSEVASADIYLAQPRSTGESQDFNILSSPDGSYGVTLGRLRPLSGRLPDPDSTVEVALNVPAAESLGLHVGDTLDAQTLSPAGFDRLVNEGTFELDGPPLGLQVVGIVQSGEDLQGSTQQSGPWALASPKFGEQNRDAIARSGSTSQLRVSDPDAIDGVREAVAGYEQFGVATAEDSWVGPTRSALNVVVVGTLVFALLALVAGVIAVGQAISRQVASDSDDVLVVRAMGLTRAERVAAAGLPSVAASSAGAVLALCAAVAMSNLYPLALGRVVEVDPGIQVDGLVLGLGLVVVTASLVAWTWFSARRRDRQVVAPRPDTRGRTLASLAGLGAPVGPRLGSRFALDRGNGRRSLPTRSSLLGIGAGVAGVAAALVFTASLHHAIATPSDYGWTWSSSPDFLQGDPASLFDQLAADEDLSAVGAVFTGDARVNGEIVPLQSFAAMKGSVAPPLLRGRLPANSGEIAVGSSELSSLGASIGDTVDVSAPDGPPSQVEIVGEVVGSQLTDLPDLGRVVVVTPDLNMRLAGVESVFDLGNSDSFPGTLVITYREGLDAGSLEARLSETYGLGFPTGSQSTPPGQLSNIEDMTPLVVGLFVFAALLGTIGLIHILVVSTRRRSREFGVMSALGFRRSQLRLVVWFQAFTLIGVGLFLGIPIGILLGGVAWRAAVHNVGMIVRPSTPWVLVGLFVVVAFVATWFIALLPSSWAARRRPAVELRAE